MCIYRFTGFSLYTPCARARVISQAPLRKMYAGTRFSLFFSHTNSMRGRFSPLLLSPFKPVPSIRDAFCPPTTPATGLFVPSLYTRLN